jgi:hypothetical protein
MLTAVNHKINQVLTYFIAHIIFLYAHLHIFTGAYYKFANLHIFGCTFGI